MKKCLKSVLTKTLLMSLLGYHLLLGHMSPLAESTVLKKSNGDINIAAMVEELEKHLKQHFWKVT